MLKDLNILSKINCSIVFFISPSKINKIIEEIKVFFKGRKILICREMSKFYEEYLRFNVDDIKPYIKIPKGELTIIISGIDNNQNVEKKLTESDKKKIKKMIKSSSIKDIVSLFIKEKDVSKKKIYNYCLSLKKWK